MKTLLKWMIWWYHYFWKHPCISFSNHGVPSKFGVSLSMKKFRSEVWDLMEGDYTVISDIPSWAGVDVATLPSQVGGFFNEKMVGQS